MDLASNTATGDRESEHQNQSNGDYLDSLDDGRLRCNSNSHYLRKAPAFDVTRSKRSVRRCHAGGTWLCSTKQGPAFSRNTDHGGSLVRDMSTRHGPNVVPKDLAVVQR
jgi:hypothetical protein